MNELLSRSGELKKEATNLLEEYQLMSVFKRYGNPLIGGSFDLEVMTSRHFVVYIGSSALFEEHFFKLGKEIAVRLQPTKMVFINEQQKEEQLHWSVYTDVEGYEWKIDISLVPTAIVQHRLQYQQRLKAKITEEKKARILLFKQQSGYNRYYKSEHVYEAVLEDDVKDDMSFFVWLQQCKKRDLSL
ncbi:hypothetical protein FZC66_07605 [Priestia megaterium]|nr:hypothetical protein FZC66_07605 [Priestia megaterium]